MLRSSTERFGHGERGHRIQLDNLDELGDLAAAFNAMADRLGETQDVLEERVRERTREFIRAARLADLGILASGIAHEINTPLASITSSAEGLQRKTRTGDVPASVVNEYVTVIRDEAYRAREISTRMLSLVHQQSSELTWVELRLVVEQVESALRFRAESRGVQLAVHCSHPLETVNVNPGELVQVLVNLLANAIDASSRGDLVTLSVSLKDGNLHAEIQDQGSGILNEDRERIFEPFFTTKRPGSGTGLGLALVATLTKSHNGRVIVESESGQGSTFRVVFPMDWGQAS
jgi:signal transduction histidine kinase